MAGFYRGEVWKTVQFDFPFTNQFRLEVSNLGRVRSFNKISDGNILNGSMINGYRIIRLKLYRPREEKIQAAFDKSQQQAVKMARKLRGQIAAGEHKDVIAETTAQLNAFKKKLSKNFQKDLRGRTINCHWLIHRLVAEYFLPKPKAVQTIVGHLDFDKLNNRANNLKWMAPEENYEHQKDSPFVIEEKMERRHRRKEDSKATKLSVTKVMLLKKLIGQGKPMKQLVKQFRVTDTQIYRIKRGENWADVEAAK